MSNPERLLEMAMERARKKWSLPKNVSKGDWYNMTDYQILHRISDEISELNTEIHATGFNFDWEAIADEAADIFAFAIMGADTKRMNNVNRILDRRGD